MTGLGARASRPASAPVWTATESNANQTQFASIPDEPYKNSRATLAYTLDDPRHQLPIVGLEALFCFPDTIASKMPHDSTVIGDAPRGQFDVTQARGWFSSYPLDRLQQGVNKM